MRMRGQVEALQTSSWFVHKTGMAAFACANGSAVDG